MEYETLLVIALTLLLPLLLAFCLMSQPPHPPPDHPSSTLPIPSLSLSPPPHPGAFHFSSPADEAHFIARLLAEARSSLTAERPMHALSLVLAAVRQQRGEEGVFDALNAAREGYGLAPHVNPVRQARERQEEEQRQLAGDVDQLMSSLSLRPAWAPYSLPSTDSEGDDRRAEAEQGGDVAMDEEEGEEDASESLLEERGAGHLLDEAVRDRSQFVTCARCRGVIARGRMQQHRQMWCEADDHSG